MRDPRIAETRPVKVTVQGGHTYYWCTCGESENQPFCDGSHRDTGFEPLRFTPERSEDLFLCQCKHTKKPPYCDGIHKHLTTEQIDASRGVQRRWHKVAEANDLRENEVRTVQAGSQMIALTCFAGKLGALDNACPHQKGPLGEGTIEAGWLRCPWHGWDFHPITGKSPSGFEDSVTAFPVEVRDDGLYVQVTEKREAVRTVSDLMVEGMVKWGVQHVFGMVGHSNLGLANAIRQQEEAGRLTFIGVRHEGAAAFACSAYAKLSGRPAACLSIAGPGATNLLTGLWDARMDRAPVLALTGQVNTQVLGPGAFQEIDLASAFQAVNGFSQTVLPGSRHAELMTLALKHAIVGREVSHLIFPDEVQVLPVDKTARCSGPEGRLGNPGIAPAPTSVDRALSHIAASRRPVIIVGYGAREHMESVTRLARRLNAPVLTTFKAKGQIPDDDALAAGVLGRSGTPVASWCMNESDLLVVLGASFSDHTGISARKPIIQIDFDPMALGRFHSVEVPVWGEIGTSVERLLEGLPPGLQVQDQRGELAHRWKLWREEKKLRQKRDRGAGVNSAAIFAALTRCIPGNAVIAVDVGNNTYSFGRYFECANQTVLMSGYLGSIGYAFPAAMGAWAATQAFEALRGRPVISIGGDGGFGQYLAEFTTAVKYHMKITQVLLNNHELGKISKEQRSGNWKVWQTSLHNPDFSKYAKNCGGYGIRVNRAEDLDGAISDALDFDGPAIVEIMSDSELV